MFFWPPQTNRQTDTQTFFSLDPPFSRGNQSFNFVSCESDFYPKARVILPFRKCRTLRRTTNFVSLQRNGVKTSQGSPSVRKVWLQKLRKWTLSVERASMIAPIIDVASFCLFVCAEVLTLFSPSRRQQLKIWLDRYRWTVSIQW